MVRDGKYDSVMFVQPTRNSELKKQVQKLANKVRVWVVECVGLTVKKVLQRSDPFVKRCGRNDCPVCEHGRLGECCSRGCSYQIACKEDGRKYSRGQTGRIVYE